MLMVFGYPNGTDTTIDISDYIFSNEDNDISPCPLYQLLIQNYVIENNIFGYKPVENIYLVSIPEEIILLEKKENEENGENEGMEKMK